MLEKISSGGSNTTTMVNTAHPKQKFEALRLPNNLNDVVDNTCHCCCWVMVPVMVGLAAVVVIFVVFATVMFSFAAVAGLYLLLMLLRVYVAVPTGKWCGMLFHELLCLGWDYNDGSVIIIIIVVVVIFLLLLLLRHVFCIYLLGTVEFVAPTWSLYPNIVLCQNIIIYWLVLHMYLMFSTGLGFNY